METETILTCPELGQENRGSGCPRAVRLQLYGICAVSHLMLFSGQRYALALHFGFIGHKMLLKCFTLVRFMDK